MVAAKDRATRQISADVVPNAEAVTLHAFVAGRAKHDAMIYTDDHGSYQKLPYRHESVKHSVSEYVQRPSAYQWRGELLGAAQARIPRNLPSL